MNEKEKKAKIANYPSTGFAMYGYAYNKSEKNLKFVKNTLNEGKILQWDENHTYLFVKDSEFPGLMCDACDGGMCRKICPEKARSACNDGTKTYKFILIDTTSVIELSKQPKISAYTFKPFDHVMVRNNDTEEWKCDIFSHVLKKESIDGGSPLVVCSSGAYRQCVKFGVSAPIFPGEVKEAPESLRWWDKEEKIF